MRLILVLTLTGVTALCVVLHATNQRTPEQPYIEYGGAKISVGMTLEQVEQQLSKASLHIEMLPDKVTAIVRVNGKTIPEGQGQITFRSGRVIYADYTMPTVDSADELAQEIASAIESMDSKVCRASNYAARGTGGGFSQSIFECGSKRFDVQTLQVLGSRVRMISVNIRIGQISPR